MSPKKYDTPEAWATESMRFAAASMIEAARHWRTDGEEQLAIACEKVAAEILKAAPAGSIPESAVCRLGPHGDNEQ